MAKTDTAEVLDHIEQRLRAWGVYRRYRNDPPVGWYKIQPFARFMVRKSEDGDPFIPRDWSPEEEIDVCVQVLTMLNPIQAAALITTYVERFRNARERAERMTHMMRQRQDDFPTVRARRYWTALKYGRRYVGGWIERY